jgi:spore maturation protein CgeB
MRFVLFYHSLVSDWNNGNAHFLRGVVRELISRGHDVAVYEQAGGWSRDNLVRHVGPGAVAAFHMAFPDLQSTSYDLDGIDLDVALDGADVVIVHEWNEAELVRRIGEHHARKASYVLLFHDTHHRAISDNEIVTSFDLQHYDGVLAFGAVLRGLYRKLGLAQRAWTWQEAADVHVFRPGAATQPQGDIVWIGNWGDGERTAELREFFIEPVRRLRVRAVVYGVRYPESAIKKLRDAGIEYRGWIPNWEVPSVFAAFRATVHIPRGPYVHHLPGIPTIRMFEALACGIPLVSAPWDDREELFRPGIDFLFASDVNEMESLLRELLRNDALRHQLARSGIETIQGRHTCAHRVDELLGIVKSLQTRSPLETTA